MGSHLGEIIICALILLSISVIYGISQLIKYIELDDVLYSSTLDYSWTLHLCLNLLGYASILLPGYLIYNYVQCSKYLHRSNKGPIHRLVYACFHGHKDGNLLDSPGSVSSSVATGHAVHKTFSQEFLLLAYCFAGLQISYLTWGYLQEKVMTQEYTDADGNKDFFKDSQFLVFVNRILAFLISGLYLLVRHQPRHTTPLYKYTFCSLSNIMSSWCQYEALKYVSFPTQVLSKASKIIPVMIMGKIISRNKYEYYEYVTAVSISIGMTFFMVGSAQEKTTEGSTTISGIFLLGGYMVLDSFTSTWQNALFVEHGVTSVQMTCAVNMFSCLLTAMSLFQQSSFAVSIAFMMKYPSFIVDCLLLSICSASGQLFIFYTIAQFGSITFVIMMTIRQVLAILLSVLIYQHHITIVGILGVLLVFGSVFLRIYCSQRLRAIKQRRAQAANIKV